MPPESAHPCPFCRVPVGFHPCCCPHCGASAEWVDRGWAFDFVEGYFVYHWQQGTLGEGELQVIRQHYQQRREKNQNKARQGTPAPKRTALPSLGVCWDCQQSVANVGSHCPGCGAPCNSPETHSLRYLRYLESEVQRHVHSTRLEPGQGKVCRADLEQRLNRVRALLEEQRQIPRPYSPPPPLPPTQNGKEAHAAGHPTPEANPDEILDVLPAEQGQPGAPSVVSTFFRDLARNLKQVPTVSWLMVMGGVLLVVGLIILLETSKFYMVQALALGVCNLAALVGGWQLLRSGYAPSAGRALTLLACVVMPLNLWYYDSKGLVDHLWIPGLVCCLLYATSAMLLRDELFVYVFTGGLTLSGLLILGDRNIQRFWEIGSPATLLVVLALGCIHLEPAFPDNPTTPFRRARFGRAFTRAGMWLLVVGLSLVFLAQLTGSWLYLPFFQLFYHVFDKPPSPLASEPWGRAWALGLILAGTYGCIYLDRYHGPGKVGLWLTTGLILWAEVVFLQMGTCRVHLLFLGLALFALLTNALTLVPDLPSRSGLPLMVQGLILSGLAVLLAGGMHAWLHLVGIFKPVVLEGYPSGGQLLALFAVVVSCGTSAFRFYLPAEKNLTWQVLTYLGLTSLALLVFVFAALEPLRFWYKVSIISELLGLGLLVLGHVGRIREQHRGGQNSGAVTVHLVVGCLLLGLPLLGNTLLHRFQGQAFATVFHGSQDVCLLLVGTLLLVSGCVCKLKAPTLTGVVLQLGYLLSLVLLLRLPQMLQTTAVLMIFLGGLIFTVTLLLTLWRERLKQLPQQYKTRQGLFQVLDWR